MIDIDLRATVSDAKRRFDLAVSFSTRAPITALYGPSGAGKSLTLQSIAGLLRPAMGHIRIGATTLYDSAAGVNIAPSKRGIGYLFQNYALFPHLTVRENVGFGLTNWYRPRPRAIHQEQIDSLLESFGIQAMADSRPHTLSGGQQQRVALARALACKPRLLLLDEPFAALNPMLRASLRQELAQVSAKWNIPVLMITHDIEDVLALANVVFVYEQGQIVQEVDLQTAEKKDHARIALTGAELLPVNPMRERVRALLSSN